MAGVAHAHHFASDSKVRRPTDHVGARKAAPPRYLPARPAPSATDRLVQQLIVLKEPVEQNLLQISIVLLGLGCAGWCWLTYNEFRAPGLVVPTAAYAMAVTDDAGIGEDGSNADSFATSSHVRIDSPLAQARKALSGKETAASLVAREWGIFAAKHLAERGSASSRTVPAKGPNLAPAIRLASLETPSPSLATNPATAIPSHIRPQIGAQTALVDFETAPFPYRGIVPGSDRQFLNVDAEGHPGHSNFRGHVFWESQTFSDDRVLLHIPPGFDPTLPAVMVVFFHGHGASLARDVRDRQQVPAQITAAGVNAVLVAPQFAVEAADSSAGKFWEPNGFKRFLDEAAIKLARLYGDQNRTAAFAKMPIVIVAYSGGFGPTLSVLERGGVRQRIRGVVLLDALYAGIDKFADWIAGNRSSFFVSAFTPHTAQHNSDLARMLSERSVSYGSELRSSHLQGMVTFLPAGDVSHRDFVNRAWAEYPIKDILARMDNVDSKVATAGTSRSIFFNPLSTWRN
jgi:hypothetical protein